MGSLSRRTVLVSGVSLSVSGCLGPSRQADDVVVPTDDSVEDEPLDEDGLERITDIVLAATDHFLQSSELLATWDADPSSVGIEEFDALRADSRSLITQYERDVLPHQENLRNPEVTESWDGDGPALSELLDVHESLLFAIETVSIAMIDAEGDPDQVPSMYQDTIENVIDEGPTVAAETEAAVGRD